MKKLAKVIAGNIEDLKEYRELRIGLPVMIAGLATVNIAATHLMFTIMDRINRRERHE